MLNKWVISPNPSMFLTILTKPLYIIFALMKPQTYFDFLKYTPSISFKRHVTSRVKLCD